MKEDKKWTKIRHEKLKNDGVSDPVKVDNFVHEVYELMKERGFSIVESEYFVTYLSNRIDSDKQTILREPLKNVEKYNKED